jgi:hypothetical protein
MEMSVSAASQGHNHHKIPLLDSPKECHPPYLSIQVLEALRNLGVHISHAKAKQHHQLLTPSRLE